MRCGISTFYYLVFRISYGIIHRYGILIAASGIFFYFWCGPKRSAIDASYKRL